jgi:hypothetical protein
MRLRQTSVRRRDCAQLRKCIHLLRSQRRCARGVHWTDLRRTRMKAVRLLEYGGQLVFNDIRRRRRHATRSWSRSGVPPSIIWILLRHPERQDSLRPYTSSGCGPVLERHCRETAGSSRDVAEGAGSGKTPVTWQDRTACGLGLCGAQ